MLVSVVIVVQLNVELFVLLSCPVVIMVVKLIEKMGKWILNWKMAKLRISWLNFVEKKTSTIRWRINVHNMLSKRRGVCWNMSPQPSFSNQHRRVLISHKPPTLVCVKASQTKLYLKRTKLTRKLSPGNLLLRKIALLHQNLVINFFVFSKWIINAVIHQMLYIKHLKGFRFSYVEEGTPNFPVLWKVGKSISTWIK